jgi:hypothetical protein
MSTTPLPIKTGEIILCPSIPTQNDEFLQSIINYRNFKELNL